MNLTTVLHMLGSIIDSQIKDGGDKNDSGVLGGGQ
jgi:hypothetical protein